MRRFSRPRSTWTASDAPRHSCSLARSVVRLLRHHRHPRHHARARRSAAPASGSTPATTRRITDALRLARGMTYKNAVAGLNLGGGKSVIIGDNKHDRPRNALPRARPLRRDPRRPLHHRRRRRDQPRRHGVRQARDRARGRPARPLGRSVAGDRATASTSASRRRPRRGGASDGLAGKTVAVQGCGNVATISAAPPRRGREADRHRHRRRKR